MRLKPCPFCGESVARPGQRWTGRDIYTGQYNHFIFCGACMTQGPHVEVSAQLTDKERAEGRQRVKEQITQLWNHRHSYRDTYGYTDRTE